MAVFIRSGWVLALALLCLCAFVAINLSEPYRIEGGMQQAALIAIFGLGAVVLPLAAILLAAAALREPRLAPRALLWLAVTGVLGSAGLVVAADLQIGPEPLPLDTTLVFLFVFVAPVMIIASLPGLYFGLRALPELRAILKESRVDRALGVISAHGEIRFTDLAQEIAILVEDVDDLVEELLRSGRLVGTMDARRGYIITAAALAQKQQALLDAVQARGKVRLEMLMRLLDATHEQVRDWIYQLVQRGQFRGYINWQEGILYSSYAKHIGENSQCPQCGGKLSPAGASTIRCEHCGTVILA
jgi:hypothetical protein